jgi:hypothetical protein
MFENKILIIIAVVIGGGILAAIGYYIARFMRGSIKLSLPNTAFDPGTTINGSFSLNTKKDIEGNKLVVRLIAIKETRSHGEGNTKTRTQEIYRDEVLIEGAKLYPAGTITNYDFQISTPDSQSQDSKLSSIAHGLVSAISLLSDKTTRIKWKLEARLDAKGVDLVDTKSITLNMKQLM